ncbi:MAG: PEP-CTERM sorting domain-containing protein [Verrucomicrobiota bacterium]
MILLNSRVPALRYLLLATLALSGLATAPLAQAGTLLIDFGPNDTANGVISPVAGTVLTPNNGSTGVADSNGNYWNNAIATTAGINFTPTSLTNLVNIANELTNIGVTFSSGWKSNGIQNGGLLTPTTALLGNLGIKNATQDYFFVENGNGTNGTASFTLNNLNPGFLYNIDIFGTRNTASVRNTLYSITDAFGAHSFTLQTSGAGSGFNGALGNDDTVAGFTGLAPDALGNLTVNVSFVNSAGNTFGYLGAAQITEVVPEPGVTVMLATGLLGLLTVRRRRSAPLNA